MKFVRLVVILFFCSGLTFADTLPDFTDLAKNSVKYVVHITSKKNAPETQAKNKDESKGNDPDELLKRFFGDPQSSSPSTSFGSGFIYDKNGYIITNHHVIKDADEIEVSLSDISTYTAKVIGSDEVSDIALLKIEATNLPFAKLGNSTDLKVGEWVVAIGSPFGFDHTVTKGIVSAISRSLANEIYTPFIQTDVPTNPGNSGGPLINLKGEVVGVNSMIVSKTGTYIGLSFAIPIDTVKTIVTELRANKKIIRGWLGVSIQTVTKQLADSFGLKKPSGALVAEVVSDSPAEKAGIKSGDVILKFNNNEIVQSSDLPPIVGATPVNFPIEIELLRNRKIIKISATLSPLKNSKISKTNDAGDPDDQLSSNTFTFYGMTVENTQEKTGVQVAKITKSGPAVNSGIQVGDLILRIKSKDIKSVDDCQIAIRGIPSGTQVPFFIKRGTSTMFIPIKSP
ncbi:MAG: Do family serine endopeptidase [Methylacidiphilales bacterium]|nr:Do family serine endopeptidase [Candidatus Methylacidiphilales bacterium]